MAMKRIAAVAALFLVFVLSPVLAFAANGYATASVTLRAGPGMQYPPVAVLASGTPLTIYGCLNGHGWCDVSDGFNRGWAPSVRLQGVYESRRVPIDGYASAVGIPLIAFGVNDYWNRHYRGKPFFRDRGRFGGAGATRPGLHQQRPEAHDRRPGTRRDRQGFGVPRADDFQPRPEFRGQRPLDRYAVRGRRPADRPAFNRRPLGPAIGKPGFDRPRDGNGPNRTFQRPNRRFEPGGGVAPKRMERRDR